MLRAAFLEDLGAAEVAWHDFEASADFDHLSAAEMRLIALVSRRLDALAPVSPMRARMGGIERMEWSRSQLAIAEAGNGLRALEAEHVAMLVIGGASRVAAGGGSTRGLATDTVDVVVQHGDHERACHVLTAAGWEPDRTDGAIGSFTRRPSPGSGRLGGGRLSRLGLHRSAFRPPHARDADDASIWERAVPGRMAGVNVRVPCATDAVTIALAGGVLDAHGSGDRLADVTASIDRGVDWELFGAIAERRRLHVRGALVLGYVHERLARPVPGPVLRTLEGQAIRRPLRALAVLGGPRDNGGRVGWLRLAGAVALRGRGALARVRTHGGPEQREARRMTRYYLLRSMAAPFHLVRPLVPNWTAMGELAARLSFVRSIYGPYLLNTPGDRTFELCVRGYGPFVADAIASQGHPFVFLDIGANLGLFSLLAATNPHCERVVAIEPLPIAFRSLQANIERNRAAKIEAIRGAVVATVELEVDLLYERRHSGTSRVVPSGQGSVRAPVISAEALDRLFPAPPRAVVVKIDVEGSEVDVVSTLRRTRFYGLIMEIIIEVSERNLGSAQRSLLLELLADDGYEEVSRSGAPEHYDARYTRVRAAKRLENTE